MASPSSPEASEIRRRGRRRLLGAVTLVLLAVVFIPMILDSEPRPQRTTPSLAIPPKENVAPLPAPTPAASTKVVVADKAPPSASGEVDVPTKTPQQGHATPSSATPQGGATPSSRTPQGDATPSSRTPQGGDGPGSNSPAAKLTPVPPKTPPESPAKPSPKLEGFAVQVGAFRDEERLRQTRAKLEAAGVVHYTERIDSGGAPMTRLRAGPFPSREAAEQARTKLKTVSLDGQVVPLP